MSTAISSKTMSAFAQDVLDGLSAPQKHLSSKYFYDAKGDTLFQQIMAMPEYYLTDAEFDVFRRNKTELSQQWIKGGRFDLIELGAGDGSKTKVLLENLLELQAEFRYRPIDISGNILKTLSDDLTQTWPQLTVAPIQGDYFKALAELPQQTEIRKVILFLGSNLGNFTRPAAKLFLQRLQQLMSPGDQLLIGIDLKKDPQVILDAYNDKAGITRDFNLNLLNRMNRELGADFQVDQFKHWETYNPVTGATKSYLVSKCDQKVWIKALNRSFEFAAWEAIDVELSQKYSLKEIEALALQSGFSVREHYLDAQKWFVDSLWEKER